jgi:uncharacterized protein YndB with AHSA1/START domain
MKRERPVARIPEADRTLSIQRMFNAPRDLVWNALTDPKHAKRWWGPKGFDVVYLEMDVRPGGAWTKWMRSSDGMEVRRGGVYTEIVRPERLVFTYPFQDDPKNGARGYETLVTVTLTEVDGKTKLTLHQALFESVAARDAHQRGWTSTIERLGDYMEDLLYALQHGVKYEENVMRYRLEQDTKPVTALTTDNIARGKKIGS